MKQSNPEEPPAEPLYPTLPGARPASPQTFRLQKIDDLEAFLRDEVESRCHLNKKYCRAINVLDSTCGTLGMTCIATGAVGAGLLASGVGFGAGLVLEVVTGVAGLLDVGCIAVSRRCAVKAAKHEAVRVLAASKLNSVHSHISKALEDSEYKLVLDEVEKYRTMKEELRRKSAAVGNVVDEETKKLADPARSRRSARLFRRNNEKTRGFRVSVSLNCVCSNTCSRPPSPVHAMRPTAPPAYWI